MDPAPERYALKVASATAAAFGAPLAGVYLHGSAVLGGFDARRSDVDVLVVCDGPMTSVQQSAVAGALSGQRLPCPGRGLELSIVTLQVAQHPVAEPAFELHLATAPEDTKVIDGHRRGGDPDLVLHFAVCRSAGRLAGPGLPAAEAFGPVADDLVLAQLATELRWGAEHATGEYAVLNACRAWRFAVDGALVSKIDGGRWALGRVPGPDRGLIKIALDSQRSIPAAGLDRGAVRQFVRQVLARLAQAPA
ncbi:MAG TPA: aminoglycoside adenylyltransferase domain-containing protein [Streptosporangiaceae bacterium]|jgi:streptomycin 3"-adenylyltransferase